MNQLEREIAAIEWQFDMDERTGKDWAIIWSIAWSILGDCYRGPCNPKHPLRWAIEEAHIMVVRFPWLVTREHKVNANKIVGNWAQLAQYTITELSL